MAKLPHQTQPPPVDDLDAATKAYADSSGGGGPVAAAQGDYIHAALSTNQLDPAISAVVDFDTTVTQRGGITVDGSGRFSTLKAGRTYLLEAALGITDSVAALVEFQWYNVTGAAYLTSTFGQTITPTSVTSTASFPVAGTIITPTEDIQVELHVTGKFATPDILSDRSWARIVEIGAVQANVIGGLEYMDTIEVSGDTTDVTFGAGGDGILGASLDGDADEEYLVTGYFPTASAPTQYLLRPNNISINQTGGWGYQGTSSGSSTRSDILLGDGSGTWESWFECLFTAKTGVPRFARSKYAQSGAGGNWTGDVSARWNDTSTAITSLVIHATAANQIKAGAQFVLWRRKRSNLRADSASTYERNVEATVAQGTNAEVEYTTGHATFQGSAIGVSVSLNDTVTAGTITVNLKVAGSTVLTAVLDTTNTFFKRTIESVGVHAVAPGDEIIVGIATSGLTTTGGGTPGITVNSTLVNDALVQPAVLPDYLYARLSADQTTNLAATNHVEFDTGAGRGTSISLQTGAGQADGLFDLAGGKTYEIDFGIMFEVNEGTFVVQLWDHVGAAAVVDICGIEAARLYGVDNSPSDTTEMTTTKVIFAPAADVTVKVEILSSVNPVRVYYQFSFISIKELR